MRAFMRALLTCALLGTAEAAFARAPGSVHAMPLRRRFDTQAEALPYAAPTHPLTTALQVMHAAIACDAIAAQPGEGVMDRALASTWSAFESQAWLTHTPLFEAHVAVFAFVAWIAFFESIHLWLPNAAEWRLDGKAPINTLACFDPRHDFHKSVVPAVTYLGSIWLGQQVGLFTYLYGPKPTFVEAPTLMQFAVEVSLGVFLYDLLFYPFHRAFHTGPISAWRRLHGRHHRYGGEEEHAHNACETVQNSYLDAGIQVFINIFVQNVSPWGFAHKHPLSRVAHNLIVTYLLTESHSGYDLPFQSHNLFPGLLGGSPRHEEHHQTGATCYHQFFRYIDDWTGRGPRAVHARPLGRAGPRWVARRRRRRRSAGGAQRGRGGAAESRDVARAPAADAGGAHHGAQKLCVA